LHCFKEEVMRSSLKPRSIYDVFAVVGCLAALTTGTAYAANTVFSADIVDGEVKAVDLGGAAVTNSKLGPNSVGSGKIIDETIAAADIAPSAVTGSEILTSTIGADDLARNSVGAAEVQNDSIDSGEIVDFGLSNEDIGVLFAQVNADGTIFNSSGGVTGTKLGGAGTYDVDFGRDIAGCGFYATQGEGNNGGAGGAILGVADRSGNSEAVFVTVRTNADVLVDRAFQLLVVC
jgi:hypothetical protein